MERANGAAIAGWKHAGQNLRFFETRRERRHWKIFPRKFGPTFRFTRGGTALESYNMYGNVKLVGLIYISEMLTVESHMPLGKTCGYHSKMIESGWDSLKVISSSTWNSSGPQLANEKDVATQQTWMILYLSIVCAKWSPARSGKLARRRIQKWCLLLANGAPKIFA